MPTDWLRRAMAFQYELEPLECGRQHGADAGKEPHAGVYALPFRYHPAPTQTGSLAATVCGCPRAWRPRLAIGVLVFDPACPRTSSIFVPQCNCLPCQAAGHPKRNVSGYVVVRPFVQVVSVVCRQPSARHPWPRCCGGCHVHEQALGSCCGGLDHLCLCGLARPHLA